MINLTDTDLSYLTRAAEAVFDHCDTPGIGLAVYWNRSNPPKDGGGGED